MTGRRLMTGMKKVTAKIPVTGRKLVQQEGANDRKELMTGKNK